MYYYLHIANWLCPDVEGRPLPVSSFTLTMINDQEALMYGGFEASQNARTSDLHLITYDDQHKVHVQ